MKKIMTQSVGLLVVCILLSQPSEGDSLNLSNKQFEKTGFKSGEKRKLERYLDRFDNILKQEKRASAAYRDGISQVERGSKFSAKNNFNRSINLYDKCLENLSSTNPPNSAIDMNDYAKEAVEEYLSAAESMERLAFIDSHKMKVFIDKAENRFSKGDELMDSALEEEDMLLSKIED